ncbi:MAG: insulinase family protein [Candidatus Eremiobacteraeota bacterium]|nr:insulinase family protein [Candidatus Eremiobacteraeota bacterium]
MRIVRYVAATALAMLSAVATAHAAPEVGRATLSNGLRVIVVRNTLAPVVTAMINYEAGSDEQWIPGLAHATEHMMFRGSASLSSSQLMDAVGITGGDFDADTTPTVTQYFFTVPSEYLEIALRAERSRAMGVLMTPQGWAQERGPITQEVQQDNSDALNRLFVKMQQRLIGGTPYAKNTLGTVKDFLHSVSSAQLLKFYREWYHPNNAVYIIAGDVDPAATIEKVKQIFGDVPAATLPSRQPVRLRPLEGTVYHDTSDQPYNAVALGYRFPGYDSADYAAGEILADVLSSQRSTFGGLPFTGKALATQFVTQTYPKVGIAVAFGAVPVTTPPQTIDRQMRGLLEEYRKSGVPPDLVEAAKLREISELEFNANSIEGLANEWSQAVAIQGLSSPDAMIERYQAVTAADVDRVLRRYIDDRRVVAAYAVSKNNGTLAAASGQMAKENNAIPPSTHQPLPPWAQHVLDNLGVPEQTLSPSDMRLANGMRLIVQPEHITHTVVVAGEIRNDPQVQEPAGKEGVADVTASLFPYGTTSYDRLALQSELDKIAATTEAGTDFGLDVLSSSFERGLQLLADEELHPAFDPANFGIVRAQTAGELVGEMTAPDHLAQVAQNKALYPPGDPSQRYATPKSVNALTLADVKAWYAAAYRPDLTTIVVIGDTSPDAARALVEKYFGAWTATGPKPNVDAPAVPPNAPAQVNVPATGRVQSSVQLVQTLPVVRADPAWAPLQVANAVLSGGFYSSLLYHTLREVHGYAYDVESRVSADRVRGVFSVEYGCDPQNVLPAEAQVQAVLEQLQREPIAADRLLRSKALLMGEVPIRESSYDGVAAQLLRYSALDMPLDQNLVDARAELGASAASVQSAMAKYIRPAAFVRVVTGPAPR